MKEFVNENPSSIMHDDSVLSSVHKYFSIIYRHGRVMHDKALKQFDVTGQQMLYIRCINENPGISQEELAKYLQIDKGAIAKSIKDLVAKDLIERKQNPDDKRAYCLFPTEKAIEIHKLAQDHCAQFEKNITIGMTDKEVKTLIALLGKVTDNILKMMEGGKI